MTVQKPLPEASLARWIRDSGGNVSEVFLAWENGGLAELPVGKAWDVVRLEQPAGWAAIRMLQKMGLPLGPVLYAHLAVEVPVPVHTADGWDLVGSTVLGDGETLLVPHTRVVVPSTQQGRSWIGAPNLSVLTNPDDLYGTYFAALAKDGEPWGVRR
ncbi:hypothetical protein [Streptomyces niphimycinicus]|uniref:hypothetical protein n=1 Tax=Streptomyces niphimycinicus TaxID=2842201 RepID=UPI00209AEA3C|nr:hypothetical protein [Streptomyces niphimycinicus]